MTSCASTPAPERWDDPAFAPVLTDFKRRFRETNTEEGVVMETVLAYAMDQAYTSSRRTLLSEYRNSEKVRWLIERGVLELDALRHAPALRTGAPCVLTVYSGDISNEPPHTLPLAAVTPAVPLAAVTSARRQSCPHVGRRCSLRRGSRRRLCECRSPFRRSGRSNSKTTRFKMCSCVSPFSCGRSGCGVRARVRSRIQSCSAWGPFSPDRAWRPAQDQRADPSSRSRESESGGR